MVCLCVVRRTTDSFKRLFKRKFREEKSFETFPVFKDMLPSSLRGDLSEWTANKQLAIVAPWFLEPSVLIWTKPNEVISPTSLRQIGRPSFLKLQIKKKVSPVICWWSKNWALHVSCPVRSRLMEKGRICGGGLKMENS